MPDNRRIAAEVERLAAPVAAFLGLDIVQVTYRRESHGWVLRLLIERTGEEGGVQVGDCQRLSRELGDVLDVEDPMPTQYRLEVSSPGLDRPLVKPVDFERFSGRRVRLRTSQPHDGQRNFSGVLRGLREDRVALDLDGHRIEIEREFVAQANLVPEIDGVPSS